MTTRVLEERSEAELGAGGCTATRQATNAVCASTDGVVVVVAACVHEHVRHGAWCARCQADATEGLAFCRRCQKLGHLCVLSARPAPSPVADLEGH